MRGLGDRKVWLGALCAATIALAATAAPARAEIEPLFLYVPVLKPPEAPVGQFQPSPGPPPVGQLSGLCGATVDSAGRVYVSDHYHDRVDLLSTFDFENRGVWRLGYFAQLNVTDPLDGPCGLALGAGDALFVNTYHRDVTRYAAYPSFGAGTVIDSSDPTGVAADPTSGRVYVDDRSYVAVYDSAGAPVLDGEGEPLRIGEGSLGDGHGVAVSRYPGTLGYVYVPDAADDTVKVYDPATDPDNPVGAIDGHATAAGGFVSLRDSAVAVDRVSGAVYVADNLQPLYTEQPQAAIQVFGPSGTYLGHLEHYVSDARPPGLAVDNSTSPATQGRVYVTSGNAVEAGVYGYEPGAATLGFSLPGWPVGGCAGIPTCVETTGGASVTGAGSEAGLPAIAVAATSRVDGGSRGGRGSSAVAARTTQKGNVRLALSSSFSPRALPRRGSAPIAASVDWRLATTDGSAVPVLEDLQIEINRHGRFDHAGLPICPYDSIQPASSARALEACRSALVGRGSFSANVALEGQEAYDARGQLLVFNGRSHGKPVLLGQIYAAHPFPTSFVITFAIDRLRHGTYGTALRATLPKALASWGNLTGIEMTLSRRYTYRGRRHSFISAGCPAPEGFSTVSFPLARASFGFRGAPKLKSTFVGTCEARG